jgi:glucosamine 6-phosphate synthetase-like amidotransferase/phosphosugar isomerase protein
MFLRRLVGFLLIVAAVAGIIFSLISLVEIWRYRPVVTKTVTDNLALVDQTLGTTQDVLTLVGQVVQTTSNDIASLQATTQALAQTIHDTNPMLDSLISLTSKDFPASISATQTSLASAQSSALLIDNVLAVLTTVPLSPVAAYKPDVQLHTALAEVSTSLDTLNPSLATIKTSLAVGKTNLGVMEVELTKISKTTQGISTTLAGAQTAIDQYKAVTAQLKASVEAAQRAAQTWMTAITWILSFVLGWLLIAQLGLGMQGLDMLRGRREPHSALDSQK